MHPALAADLDSLLADRSPHEASIFASVEAIMAGQCSDAEIASWLTALRLRGESVDALVGAARALRTAATPVRCQSKPLVDTCGTGGDSSGTFNISTAAAIAAAACGAAVAKHGNRSVTSRSGSADVLEALGIRIDLSPDLVARSIDEAGFGFCFAPQLHGALKHAGPARRALGFRTLFNLVGPLSNPAGASCQVVGHANPAMCAKLAEALQRLGCERAAVVCGNGEVDELCLWGKNLIWLVDSHSVTYLEASAADWGLEVADVASLRAADAVESASLIRSALGGAQRPARDIVCLNAAAALWAAGRSDSLPAGLAVAEDAVRTGAAIRKLDQIIAFSQSVGA